MGTMRGARTAWTVMKEVTLPPMFQSRRATGFDERGEGMDRALAMTTSWVSTGGGTGVSLLAENSKIPRKRQQRSGAMDRSCKCDQRALQGDREYLKNRFYICVRSAL